MKIKLIKKIEILSSTFTITYDKKKAGASFSWEKTTMTIGIRDLKNDPIYTLGLISHELMEVILVGMGARLDNGRISDVYLFNFDHQLFENAIEIHIAALTKFIR
jgi:hypothetical protein